MDNLYTQKVINVNNLFDDHFLDAKVLYLHCFNMLPCLNFINYIDGEKTFAAIKEKFGEQIRHIHQYRWYKRKKKRYQFDRTLIILNNNCIVELDEGYCEILHNGSSAELIAVITTLASQFKERQRRQPLEINLIAQSKNRLELKPIEIKRTKLDLDLFYEDDFKAVDEVIQERLRKKEDKGIVLLHGLPGTGKTTYLRYLIGRIKKRVLFVSPNIAKNLMNPEFVDLLIDNPNTVVIIEDAEHIIMDRRTSGGSSVSNLLNISDGLLADFLNVQLICTFNSSLTMIDSALLRKGRLIAKYEFGKLSMAKAQALSNHLGFDAIITKPMTIAEVANQHEKEPSVNRLEITGFHKRELIEN